MAELKDYEQEYEKFWREIVENPDGTLKADQVKRELFDYSELMKRTSEVYSSVTGGLIGKPETMAHHVIDAANRRLDAAVNDAINDLIKSLEMGGDQAFVSVAAVVDLIRELSGVEPE